MPTFRKFYPSIGFTLIELLIAMSIVAILTTIGISLFTNATVKARDTQRKNDLRKVQTALELYYEKTGSYPTGDNANCIAIDESFKTKVDPYLKDFPKDPTEKIGYCYLSNPEGNRYTLFAKLENCQDEANINKDKCDQDDSYNYAISSEDAYITQTPVIPDAQNFTNFSLPIPNFNPFNRPTSSSVNNLCNGFTVGNRQSHDNQSWYPLTPRLTSWNNISKVKVYYYSEPKSLTPPNTPFIANKWVNIGETTAVGQQINFPDPGPGEWYIGMDVYNNSNNIIDPKGTGTTTNCTQILNI